MKEYWNTRTNPTAPANSTVTQPDDNSVLSDFDRHRLTLVANQSEDEGWQSEKARYLADIPANVTKSELNPYSVTFIEKNQFINIRFFYCLALFNNN